MTRRDAIRSGRRALGVVRALVKFKLLRDRVRFRKSVSAACRIGFAVFCTFVLALHFVTRAFEGQHEAVQLVAVALGTVFASTVAITVALVAVSVRRWPGKPVLDEENGAVSIEALEGLAQSGDLILFSYPVRFSGCCSGFLVDMLETVALKVQSGTHWTHVGVVLRAPNGNVYLCEATTDDAVAGHVGPGLCRLAVRLGNSCDYDRVVWRRCGWTTMAHEREEREAATFSWALNLLAGQDAGRYRLDLFRASGKIAFDFGLREYGRLMAAAGYPFEYDCAYFASCTLLRLGVLKATPEEMMRLYSLQHFCAECEGESAYRLSFSSSVAGFGPQVPIRLLPTPRQRPESRLGQFRAVPSSKHLHSD